ncbi:unnamed protein product [Dovyalis caffra]|uniref:O-methyltransferase C-terminal domain-containing protein n=1 Tax=Dovyalis caffra TaxID=77055 RepID=A0AAV1SXZ3_9ROSI|nr:unnamed protein product [Dovyalis caffra]
MERILEIYNDFEGLKTLVDVGGGNGSVLHMSILPLTNISHNWNDEHFIKLLKNCYEALQDNGKVIVVDLVVPETPETSFAAKSMLQFFFYMTSMNPCVKERTVNEFKSSAKEAGFFIFELLVVLVLFQKWS